MKSKKPALAAHTERFQSLPHPLPRACFDHARDRCRGIGAVDCAGTGDRGDYDWKLFVGPSYVSPLSDSDVSNVGNSIEASSELGYEIGIEWKGTDRLGFEIAYLDLDTDLETSLGTIGDISMRPWMFSMNFHVVDKNAFNWYVGPTLAYVGWSDLKLSNGTRYDVDGESTFGVSTGFVVGLGETFGIQFGLRYIDASIDAGLADEISVDPLFAGVAVAFRF